jgi:hypothetical protein
MTHYRSGSGLPKPSEWMFDKIADAMASDLGQMAFESLHKGHKNLAVMYSFSRAPGPVEDYTCDKCRVHHPEGLNAIVFGFGEDVEFGHTVVTDPASLVDWSALVVTIGLCHECFEAEGFPHNPLRDIDRSHVQQIVRLIEAPPAELFED